MSALAARAARLGAAVKLHGAEPGVSVDDMIESGTTGLWGHEVQALRGDVEGDHELALVNACLEVERDLRARQWAALEALLALWARVPDGHGRDAAAWALGVDEQLRLALLAVRLGWWYDAPEDPVAPPPARRCAGRSRSIASTRPRRGGGGQR